MKTILLDAGISHDLYGRSEQELAAEYLFCTRQLSTQICPTINGTLFDEALDVKRCLDRIGARSAILMTSDFETCRTLDISKNGCRNIDGLSPRALRHTTMPRPTGNIAAGPKSSSRSGDTSLVEAGGAAAQGRGTAISLFLSNHYTVI